jgi:hypothetical protein
MKEYMKAIGYCLIGIAILVIIGFGSGKLQALYNRTVGTDIESSQTDIYHNNKGYIDGMTSDLANYKRELTTEKDPTARQAIINLIVEKYANFPQSNIKDPGLRQFLVDVKNGNID